MTAQGIAARFSDYARPIWSFVLFVGFLTLPLRRLLGRPAGQALDRHPLGNEPSGEEARGQPGPMIYYSLLSIYAVWGTITLALLAPLQIAIVGAVLGNVALGFSAFHTLYVNRTLLPRQLRPNLLMQLGLIGCGVFASRSPRWHSLGR